LEATQLHTYCCSVRGVPASYPWRSGYGPRHCLRYSELAGLRAIWPSCPHPHPFVMLSQLAWSRDGTWNLSPWVGFWGVATEHSDISVSFSALYRLIFLPLTPFPSSYFFYLFFVHPVIIYCCYIVCVAEFSPCFLSLSFCSFSLFDSSVCRLFYKGHEGI
jgi:hypothetical protein